MLYKSRVQRVGKTALNFCKKYDVHISGYSLFCHNHRFKNFFSNVISYSLFEIPWPSPIMSGFHGSFATGVACQQGTLTLPDTWFRPPFWDLLMLQLLRPNSSNLPCLYSTFHLEYPLVLSRFCLFISYTMVVNFCQFPLTLSCNLCIHLFFNPCN